MPTLRTIDHKDSVNPDFIKPEPENNQEISPIFSERLNRTQRSYNKAHLIYNVTNEYAKARRDGIESVNKQLMQTFPELTTLRILRFTRLYIPDGVNVFEDQEGNLDKTVRSCILFSI